MRLGCGCCDHSNAMQRTVVFWCPDCGAFAVHTYFGDQQPLYFEKCANGFRCALDILFDQRVVTEVWAKSIGR